jgi:hypothetical protein
MKCTTGMGSGGMMYIPNFIMIGSSVQKLIRGTHRHIDSTGISLKIVANASELLRYSYVNFLIPYLLFTARNDGSVNT